MSAPNASEDKALTPVEQRAGRYIRQSTGYRAFLPAPLPPNPPIRLDDKLQGLLSRADRSLGRLDGSIQTLPDADLFVFMYVRKEAVLSSQIEGTQSSLDDVLAAEAKILDPDAPRDVDEVLNYVKAMNHGLERLPDLPVSTRLITELHHELLAGGRGKERGPGEIRMTQNWIGPAGAPLSQAIFVPPPPHELAAALSNWEKFIHDHDVLPTLMAIGVAHAQFETIHPFLDGNGRVGRLLIALLLTERKVLHRPVLYLSYYFKQHRAAYYDALQAVRDRGDWEGWIALFLTAVAEVGEEATTTARLIVGLRERHRDLIQKELGRATAGGLRVLESLFSRPIMSVNDVKVITRTSFAAANDLVRRLVALGVLVPTSGNKRNRRFRYDEYVRVFAER